MRKWHSHRGEVTVSEFVIIALNEASSEKPRALPGIYQHMLRTFNFSIHPRRNRPVCAADSWKLLNITLRHHVTRLSSVPIQPNDGKPKRQPKPTPAEMDNHQDTPYQTQPPRFSAVGPTPPARATLASQRTVHPTRLASLRPDPLSIPLPLSNKPRVWEQLWYAMGRVSCDEKGVEAAACMREKEVGCAVWMGII